MRARSSQQRIEGRKWFGALLFVLALGTAENARAFELEPSQINYYQSGTEEARLHLLIDLIKAGKADVAEALMKRVPLEGPYAQNRTLFVEGLILESRNDLSGATNKFRTALGNDPKLNLVRAELAQVLAREGETDSAKHHLELLASEARDPEQASQIRAFMDRLDANRPFVYNIFLSVAPSTNLFQGSSHDSVFVPGFAKHQGGSGFGQINNKKASGVGGAIGGSVGYTYRVNDNVQAVVSANAVANLYTDWNFDAASLSQSMELRQIIAGGYIGLGVVASEGLAVSANPLSYYSAGPRLSMAQQLTERDRLTASAAYEWRRYPQAPDFDGNALTLSGIFTHAIDSTSNVALLTGFERVTQQRVSNSYMAGTLGLGFYKELPWGLTVEGQGTARLAQFDDIEELSLKLRQDQRLSAGVTFTKRDWNLLGFAPSVNYNYVRNFSNIEIFDFDSHSVDFRLTKDF